jgi:MurNAc alpha-1-phosphate uridylyltransferase
VDYGLGVFDARAFGSTNHRDLAGVYQELMASRQLAAYEISQRFYEIGSVEGIRDFSAYLANQEAV